eukprot:10697896-Alexandrium_andersonii.AAC.1
MLRWANTSATGNGRHTQLAQNVKCNAGWGHGLQIQLRLAAQNTRPTEERARRASNRHEGSAFR